MYAYIYGSPFYLATSQSQCFIAIGRDGDLSTQCHNCGFAYQHRVLKTFPGLGYLRSEVIIIYLYFILFNDRALFYLMFKVTERLHNHL